MIGNEGRLALLGRDIAEVVRDIEVLADKRKAAEKLVFYFNSQLAAKQSLEVRLRSEKAGLQSSLEKN